MNADPMEKVRKALEQGSLSEAIRAYREATGVSPQEAMTAVEAMMQRPGRPTVTPTNATAFQPDSIQDIERRIVRPGMAPIAALLFAVAIAIALVLMLAWVRPTPVSP